MHHEKTHKQKTLFVRFEMFFVLFNVLYQK